MTLVVVCALVVRLECWRLLHLQAWSQIVFEGPVFAQWQLARPRPIYLPRSAAVAAGALIRAPDLASLELKPEAWM